MLQKSNKDTEEILHSCCRTERDIVSIPSLYAAWKVFFSNIEKGIDPPRSHIHLMPTIHKIFLVAKASLELAFDGQLLNQSLLNFRCISIYNLIYV